MVTLSYECSCRYKVTFEGNKPRVEDNGWGIENLCERHAALLRRDYEEIREE
ncbi:MAG: hypothetical protein WA364_23580 [Candidatus Nitrosopolaris sp.]